MPLSYSLITTNSVELEKVSPIAIQSLGLLIHTLAADDLTIPIQMQLSQKKNIFCEIFAAFFKSRLNFKYFKNKDDPHTFIFSKLHTRKS